MTAADRIARLRDLCEPSFYDEDGIEHPPGLTVADAPDVLALCDDYETLAATAALFDKAAHKLTFALIGLAKGEPPLYNLDAAIAEYDTARAELRRLLGSTS